MTRPGPNIAFLLLLLLFPATASAGVAFFDNVAVTGEPVMLRAETRGRFFAKGGVLVEFRVDGKSIGRTLSGGDGVAYREYVPPAGGLLEVEVVSGSYSATGYVLSIARGGGIVFVDVENAVFEGIFSKSPREGCVDKLRELSEAEGLVFLSTVPFGAGLARSKLREGDLPPAPLLGWDGGKVFGMVTDLGLKVKAVIGGAAVTGSAAEFGAEAYSFDETGSAVKVGQWSEIPGDL